MKEIEELLRRDRAAGLPDPPDVCFTMAAVRRRLGGKVEPLWAERDWFPIAAGFGITLSTGLVVAFFSPWWLIAFPLVVLPVCPLILPKGVR